MKHNSIEELNEHRQELTEKYGGKLPEYLENFFNDEENTHVKNKFFKERAIKKYTIPLEERIEFVKEKDKEFWEENEFEVVKKRRTLREDVDPVYEEPLRNEEALEEERDLTKDEIKILRYLCESDIYLFAVRYFKHYLKKPSSRLHKFLYSTISREFKKKRTKGFKRAVAAPRGNSKSSIISTILPL